MRKLAMAAATISDLFDSNLSAAGKQALIDRAVGLVGEAISDLAELQSQTGIVEKRVTRRQRPHRRCRPTCSSATSSRLEGVDPYEASTRVTDLLSHIETSYALTARIQQLSLLQIPEVNRQRQTETTCTNSPMPTSRPTRSPTPRTASGSC